MSQVYVALPWMLKIAHLTFINECPFCLWLSLFAWSCGNNYKEAFSNVHWQIISIICINVLVSYDFMWLLISVTCYLTFLLYVLFFSPPVIMNKIFYQSTLLALTLMCSSAVMGNEYRGPLRQMFPKNMPKYVKAGEDPGKPLFLTPYINEGRTQEGEFKSFQSL